MRHFAPQGIKAYALLILIKRKLNLIFKKTLTEKFLDSKRTFRLFLFIKIYFLVKSYLLELYFHFSADQRLFL